MNADTETTARAMYDAYCDAVGGKAWNGQPLPKSGEFFTDPSKEKQADGWRAAARAAENLLIQTNNTMMTNEQKKTVRAQVNAAATQGAQKAAEAAKTATGWKKWGLIILAGILAGVALFTQTQCKHLPPLHVTPEQMQQVHGAYHVLTDQDCILVLPVDSK